MTPGPDTVALVTGASRGLGYAVAAALGAAGVQVVAMARTVGGLEELDDRIKASSAPGALTLAPMDITNDDAMRHLCASIHARWGKLDLWAHAAIHAAPLSPAGHIDLKDWDKSVAINTRASGVLLGFVEPLLGTEGTALFFDDPRAGEKFFGAYGATKSAQIALARSWQAENVKIGPRVVIAEPRPMPTATRARFFPSEDRAPLSDIRDEAKRLLGEL